MRKKVLKFFLQITVFVVGVGTLIVKGDLFFIPKDKVQSYLESEVHKMFPENFQTELEKIVATQPKAMLDESEANLEKWLIRV